MRITAVGLVTALVVAGLGLFALTRPVAGCGSVLLHHVTRGDVGLCNGDWDERAGLGWPLLVLGGAVALLLGGRLAHLLRKR